MSDSQVKESVVFKRASIPMLWDGAESRGCRKMTLVRLENMVLQRGGYCAHGKGHGKNTWD